MLDLANKLWVASFLHISKGYNLASISSMDLKLLHFALIIKQSVSKNCLSAS